MQQAPIDPPASMTQEQKALIDEEDRIRNLFAEQPNHPDISDPHVMLSNVYSGSQSFDYAPETEEEKSVPKILTQKRKRNLTGSAIVDKATFLTRFAEFTQGVFKGLDWTNVFVAGGAVLGAATSDDTGYRSSDIDMFLYGIRDEKEANEKLRSIYQTVVANTNGGNGDVIRTHRAITILNAFPYRHVQIILRLYKSPAEVLMGFDIDSCCIGYDGTDVYCMERFRRALTKRFNLVNISRRSLTYESRLYKYSKRGFAVAVPNLDKSRINIVHLSNQLPKNVQGLAKLVLFDFIENTRTVQRRRPFARRQAASADKDEGTSDYNADLHIPWGPGYHNNVIINMLEVKNRANFFSSLNDSTKPKFNHMLKSNAQKLQGGYFDRWSRALDQKDVQQPIEWIKENPAYQDFDNGYKRLMTGSFEPVVDDNWEKGTYVDPINTSQYNTNMIRSKLSTNNSDEATRTAFQQTSLSTGGFSFGSGKAGFSGFNRPKSKAPKKKAVKKKPARKVMKVPKKKTARKIVKAPRKSAPSKKTTKKAAQKSVKWGPPQVQTAAATGSFGGPISSKAGKAGGWGAPSANFGFAQATPSVGGKSVAASWGNTASASPAASSTPSAWPPAPTETFSSAAGRPTSSFGFGARQQQQQQQQQQQPQSGFGQSGGFNKAASGGLSAFGPQPGAAFNSPIKFGSQVRQTQPGANFARPGQPATSGLGAPSLAPAPSATASASPAPDSNFASRVSRALLLVSLLLRKNLLNIDQRGVIKDLIIAGNEVVFAALEVFEIDQDVNELADTWARVVRL
eukprot:TRINITY_DN2170_c0_g2_i1.p1 TRINITY_DN2170_c0_g2~~TRINITY_DN2170_c0_g2_i1.p1  ORF type:complete len:809 (-),score=217.66 TRINITY_DN2170_c0_g2_i1:6-2393(-)